jgi:hypothetical protein
MKYRATTQHQPALEPNHPDTGSHLHKHKDSHAQQQHMLRSNTKLSQKPVQPLPMSGPAICG